MRGTGAIALGGGWLLVLLAGAVAAPWLAPYNPHTIVGGPLAPPGQVHWLGTNDIGQDLLSELVYGARVSLTVGAASAVMSTSLALLVGLLAGYFARLDSPLMGFVDLLLAIPSLPLMILLVALLGPSQLHLVLVLGLLSWGAYARVMRIQTLVTREQGFVEAAVAMGAPHWLILLRHVLPGVLPLAVPKFILTAQWAIFSEASLAFLGLGDPIVKSWGIILNRAFSYEMLFTRPVWIWWVLPPALAIASLTVALGLLSQSLEGVMNPQMRH